MTSEDRKQREKQEIKRKIIDAACKILLNEGYEYLSIRKIAHAIEYTPGIIYHYFRDKQEIVFCIAEEGYQKILQSISQVKIDLQDPQSSIEAVFRNYIDQMLASPQLFRILMMNDIEGIGEKVNILEEGISVKRKSIESLSKLIVLCIQMGKFRDVHPELTAQIIWTGIYGLVSRLILEKNVSPEQKEKLISHQFDILMNGLIKK
jgi:AcrR family transcriptional regulator